MSELTDKELAVVLEAKRIVKAYRTPADDYTRPFQSCSDVGDYLMHMFTGEVSAEEALEALRNLETDYKMALEPTS
ncbi:hypothetical protein LZK73_22000 [Neorhizobium galegae]|nr:hypothetical protein LZK73_22000 [Neorhizobium galegae]